MKEKRYAILIGMDNYSLNPLPYSSKDATDLKQTLVTSCRFKEDNIYLITDSQVPVKEQIDKCFKEIEGTFNKKEDLFLFYFSGHGEYDKNEEASKILFEDETDLSIEDILLRYFYKLTPKNQYLLVDSCHAGSNIFIKGNENAEKQIRRLNYLSNEFCLMFATEKKKKAIQDTDLQNSYFTHFLIEAIKQPSNYDDDGFLTIQSIDNIIKKKILKESNNVQIPVSEIRSSGYKVFAFDEKVIAKNSIPSKKKKDTTKTKDANVENVKLNFEESLSRENRAKIQNRVVEIVDEYFEKLLPKIQNENIRITNYTSFEHIEYDELQVLYKRIIDKANSEGIEAIDGLFEKRVIEKRKPKLNLGLSAMIDNLYEQSKPDFDYNIDLYSDYLSIRTLEMKSTSVHKVSSGISIMVFQTKYGFAIGSHIQKFNWTGTGEDKVFFIDVNIVPFLLDVLDESEIEFILTEITNKFLESKNKWDEQRDSEIKKYIEKVNSKK
jgi:hypothetical protein